MTKENEMQLIIKYKDGRKDCVLTVTSEKMEVDFLTDKSIELTQLPPEEYAQGFRLKEGE